MDDWFTFLALILVIFAFFYVTFLYKITINCFTRTDFSNEFGFQVYIYFSELPRFIKSKHYTFGNILHYIINNKQFIFNRIMN